MCPLVSNATETAVDRCFYLASLRSPDCHTAECEFHLYVNVPFDDCSPQIQTDGAETVLDSDASTFTPESEIF